MPRGRTTSFTIRLTPEERRTLLVCQRLTSIPAGLARRGRMILLLADGMTISEAAATPSCSQASAVSTIVPANASITPRKAEGEQPTWVSRRRRAKNSLIVSTPTPRFRPKV